MSESEQQVLRCLHRNPQLTLSQLASLINTTPDEVEETVESLLREAYIVEQLRDGRRVFSTRFQFKRKNVRNMPPAILELFSQAEDNFLKETTLTASLPDVVSQQLLELAQRQSLVTDEVLAWQGDRLDRVSVVERGLLRQTRLKGRHLEQKSGYTRRGEWIGLGEALGRSAVTTTYTAVADTHVLSWDTGLFLEFARQHPSLALAIGRELSHRLHDCQQTQLRRGAKLWAVEGVHSGAGVTLLVTMLALLAQASDPEEEKPVLVWLPEPQLPAHPFWRRAAAPGQPGMANLGQITRLRNGLHVLTLSSQHQYPPQVQLDILLGELLAQYEFVVCDTGHEPEDPLAVQLRARAHTLVTLTCDAEGAEAGTARWKQRHSLAAPRQKRVLALNRSTRPMHESDSRFQLVIPEDAPAATAWHQGLSSASELPPGPLHEALREIFRRLSLNHAVAIFVPSTVDVDRPVDNREQVRSTLSFLGNVFGGATSSNAEGVWRAEESGLVAEQETIVRTFVSKQALERHLNRVIDFATELKREMKQEAVAVSVDNQLLLV
jgi:DNA-binding MarR family transcriptional regulator